MAENFDRGAAKDNHYRIMDKMVWAKNRIAKATDYYYDYPPQDEAHQEEVIKSVREAATEARRELDEVLNQLS